MRKQSLWKAFTHAFDGLFYFFRNDRNGKIHFAACILVAAAGWYYRLPVQEWLVLLLCFAIVIGFEMCNHALEKLSDMVQPDLHPMIKRIKDIAAAAVLWSAIISVIIGLLIFLPKITG